MKKENELKQRIYECSCNICRALVCLVEDCGANLQFSRSRAGRLCELAVVAAAGEEGIEESKVVNERRNYAKHLELEISGKIANSNKPLHIKHAIKHSNHNENPNNPIPLGKAEASLKNGRYFLLNPEKSLVTALGDSQNCLIHKCLSEEEYKQEFEIALRQIASPGEKVSISVVENQILQNANKRGLNLSHGWRKSQDL